MLREFLVLQVQEGQLFAFLAEADHPAQRRGMGTEDFDVLHQRAIAGVYELYTQLPSPLAVAGGQVEGVLQSRGATIPVCGSQTRSRAFSENQ